MSFNIELTFLNYLLASAPILLLLVTLIAFRWKAPIVGLIGYLLALLLAISTFGADVTVLWIASAKGLALSLFVLSIIWTAVLLYNVIEQAGAMEVIGARIAQLTKDQLSHSLLLAWAFSGFVQGVTGFGVPVAVVVPLMVMVGVRPMIAAVAVLIGHSWAVTFGSLGSSYYSIQLVTGIPGSEIAPTMALMFALPILGTGFAVAHITDGFSGVRRSGVMIIVTGSIMAFSSWGMAVLHAPQLSSIVAGLLGCLVIWIFSLVRSNGQRDRLMTNEMNVNTGVTGTVGHMGFHTAFVPYYLLVILTFGAQIGLIQNIFGDPKLGMDFPGTMTDFGLVVHPVKQYAAISLFGHPAPIIIASLIGTAIVLRFRGFWSAKLTWRAIERTYRQSLPPTFGIVTMVMMAVVMLHSGMTEMIARGLAEISGGLFPLASPFIGLVGAFMTGSNTNSNVMFGVLQVETARALDISAVVVASLQSIGGSIGSAATPAKVLLSTTLVGLSGAEGNIMRKTLIYTMALIALIGIEGLVVVYIG